ncbi:hypothetical protein JTS98_12320 [Clostridium botulinum]|nr:hypothetical protein [Clostridium botulinum]
MNEREIWKAIKALLESEELYYELSKNGIQAVKEKYNWKCSEEKLISIYNNLLDKRSNNE